VYLAVTFGALGDHVALHLAWVLILGALVSALLFVLLRTLGVERVHAALIALLLLVFPAADAARLRPKDAQILPAMVLFICGLLLALRGLRSSGRRAVLLHAATVACYAASLLQYEILAGPVLLAGLLYRLRASWRSVLPRWAADLAAFSLAAAFLRSSKPHGNFASVREQIDRARTIQGEARTLLTQLGIQDGRSLVPFVVIVLLVAAAVIVALVSRPSDPVRKPLRRWLGIAVAGAIALGAGYVSFFGTATDFYRPLQPGIGNRVNTAAAPGFVVLIYALANIVGLLLVRALAMRRSLRRSPVWATAFATVAAFAVGALWVREVTNDRRAWDRAAALNRKTLSVLRNAPRPPRGATIYTFGMPGQTAPLVKAFTLRYDLTGAVRLLWDDHTLRGIPSASIEPTFSANTPSNSGVRCRKASVEPRGWLYRPERDASRYGKTIFALVPTGRVVVVRNAAQCRSLLANFLR
jgi:hypothetical protein